MEFSIGAYTDHSLRNDKTYISTYVVSIGEEEVYKADMRAKLGRIQPSVLTSIEDTQPAAVIEQIRAFGTRKVRLADAGNQSEIATLSGRTIEFPDGGSIRCIDPASFLRKTFRTMLNGDPNRYEFHLSGSKNTVGSLEQPPANNGPWPFSIFWGIVKALSKLRSPEKSVCWKGRLIDCDADIRAVAVMAIILHMDQGKVA